MRGCVEHTQKGNKGGYGTTKLHGVTQYIHRVVYADHNDMSMETLAGKVVRHTCDNPRCINPEHLELGTHQDNSNDMVARGRHRALRREESHRAILTEEDVHMIKSTYVPRCRGRGARALGRLLGVSEVTIRDVLKGRTWA